MFAASLVDHDITRDHASIAGLIATPDQVLAKPGAPGRVMALGGDAPQYPLPGPSRAELLAAIR
jgi:hypothetical protein